MGTRSPARCAMIRLAISAEAFEAIVATLPLGSVRPPHDLPPPLPGAVPDQTQRPRRRTICDGLAPRGSNRAYPVDADAYYFGCVQFENRRRAARGLARDRADEAIFSNRSILKLCFVVVLLIGNKLHANSTPWFPTLTEGSQPTTTIDVAIVDMAIDIQHCLLFPCLSG